jgi:hypothetical protein
MNEGVPARYPKASREGVGRQRRIHRDGRVRVTQVDNERFTSRKWVPFIRRIKSAVKKACHTKASTTVAFELLVIANPQRKLEGQRAGCEVDCANVNLGVVESVRQTLSDFPKRGHRVVSRQRTRAEPRRLRRTSVTIAEHAASRFLSTASRVS